MTHTTENVTSNRNFIGKPVGFRKHLSNWIKFLLNVFKNPITIVAKITTYYPLTTLVSDPTYLRIHYRAYTGLKLNFENPVRFNEKLQVLKLHKRTFSYSKYTDKYEVRKYVTDTIGEQYLIPIIGLYDKVDDINFDKLPNQFALKCTHDSGSTVICKDKSKLDINKTKRFLRKKLKRNFFYFHRELQYKNITPRVMCEELLLADGKNVPPDYKIFCFEGIPKFLYVVLNRHSNPQHIL